MMAGSTRWGPTAPKSYQQVFIKEQQGIFYSRSFLLLFTCTSSLSFLILGPFACFKFPLASFLFCLRRQRKRLILYFAILPFSSLTSSS